MDKSTKEFDKLIRNKVSDVEFSGEKDSWELLSYRLKEKVKRKQKIRMIAYLFSFLLLVSGTVFFVKMVKRNESNAGAGGKRQDVQQIYTPPVNTPENTAITKNSMPAQLDKARLPAEKKSLTSDLLFNDANDNTREIQGEAVAEIQQEESISIPDFSDESLISLINSSSWESDLFRMEITNVGNTVNSAYSDFAPVISSDGTTMETPGETVPSGTTVETPGEAPVTGATNEVVPIQTTTAE